MKWIKKIVIDFLLLFLIVLIMALTLSFNLKSVFINGIIKEIITEQLKKTSNNKENITEETLNEITNDEELKKMLNNEEVENLLNKYLDITIDSMINEEKVDEIEIEKDIIEFLSNNKEDLEKITGREITDEMIDEMKIEAENKTLSNSWKQTIKSTSNSLSPTEKNIIKGYQIIISRTFKIIIVFLIVIDLFLISLIRKSYHYWIKDLSKSMITSGILIMIMCLISGYIVTNLSNINSFKTYNLQYSAIIQIIIGVLCLIIYKYIAKTNTKEEKYDISKASIK